MRKERKKEKKRKKEKQIKEKYNLFMIRFVDHRGGNNYNSDSSCKQLG